MKQRIGTFLLSIIIILTLLPAVSISAQETQSDSTSTSSSIPGNDLWSDEDAEESSNDEAFWTTFADDSRLTDIQQITVPFIIYQNHAYEYSFPYTDDFFRYSSDSFSKTLAQASMGLTVSAFRYDHDDMDPQFTAYLGKAGFSDIDTFGYDKPTSPETLSGVIAHKKIDDFTLIACAPCGQGYEKEWGGNLMVGDRVRHIGFKIGAEVFKQQIAAYREKHGIKGKMKIWISGFSRASAVANLAAADLYKSGEYTDLYAYLFGVPRTTKTPRAFQGIYNICGQSDPVTCVPLQHWMYGRYGITMFTPAQESSSDYTILKQRASKIHKEITGKPLRNNPEINHQIHLLIDFMSEIFPSSADYVENMQDTILRLWTEPNQDQIFNILSAAMLELQKTDERYAESAEVFLDYISFIATEHLSGNKKQIADGSWDPTATMGENFLREHMPSIYMAWIFSDTPAEELLTFEGISRRVMIDGKVDVEVYDNDQLLKTIYRSGTIISPTQQQTGEEGMLPDIAALRLGPMTTVSLPLDRPYRIVIHSDSTQTIYINDLYSFAGIQSEIGDHTIIARIKKGDYELRFQDINSLESIEFSALSGSILTIVDENYDDASAVLSMAEECTAEDHLTAISLLVGILTLLVLLFLIGLICLIIAIIHKIKMKKGHPPYSAWWVIVPHLVLIGIFALLTQFVSNQMILIKALTSTFSTLTMVFLFLLALRAFLRKKDARNLIVMIGMLVLCILSWLFFKDSPFTGQTITGTILYCILIVLLSVLALLGFFRKQKTRT